MQVVNASVFNVGDTVNINSVSRRVTAVNTGANTLTLDHPLRAALGQPIQSGSVYRSDYENFLQVGPGRSGGSFDNDFTKELKRIIDNPEYKEVLRHGLMKNIFISASSNDPFGNLISSKLTLNWLRNKRQVEIMQTSFIAYYKSV